MRALLLAVVAAAAAPARGAESTVEEPPAIEDVREVSQTARNLTRLTFNGRNDAPDVSPDGKEVVFEHREGRFVNLFRSSSAGGGTAVRVTNHPSDDRHPRWTPDGRRIVFASNRVAGWRIWEVAATGVGGVTMVSPGASAESMPDVSPDGRTIALVARTYQADGGQWGPHQLWTVQRDGTRLTHHRAGSQPRFSSDGRRVAFVLPDQGGREQLYVMGADGSAVTQISGGPSRHTAPCWSPDGRWIAYADDKAGNFDIWTLRPDGTSATQITTNTSYDGSPVWSRDGKYVYFTSNRGKVWEIWRMQPVLPPAPGGG